MLRLEIGLTMNGKDHHDDLTERCAQQRGVLTVLQSTCVPAKNSDIWTSILLGVYHTVSLKQTPSPYQT